MRYFNKTKWEPGWVAPTCNPSTREVGEEDQKLRAAYATQQVGGHPGLQRAHL